MIPAQSLAQAAQHGANALLVGPAPLVAAIEFPHGLAERPGQTFSPLNISMERQRSCIASTLSIQSWPGCLAVLVGRVFAGAVKRDLKDFDMR